MSIEVVWPEDELCAKPVRISSLAAGDVFVGRVNNGAKFLYLRTYSGIVNLENPANTWNRDSTANLNDVKCVDIEIHVKEREC